MLMLRNALVFHMIICLVKVHFNLLVKVKYIDSILPFIFRSSSTSVCCRSRCTAIIISQLLMLEEAFKSWFLQLWAVWRIPLSRVKTLSIHF